MAALIASVVVPGGTARPAGGTSQWDETTVCTAGCSGTYTGVYTLSSDTLSGTLLSGGVTFTVTTVRNGSSFTMHTTGPNQYSSDAKGTLSADGKSMSGTFQNASGAGSGTWSAKLTSGTPPTSSTTTTSGSAAAPVISGSASCTIDVTGTGYKHSETQAWQVGGTPTTRGAFTLVPSHWTDTGGGSKQTAQGTQTSNSTWKTDASGDGQFEAVIRASDGQLLIGQANSLLRVANGTTGTTQVTIGGVAQTPTPFGVEAFETQLPPIAGPATSRTVAGSTPSTTVEGSFGPFQPGGSVVKEACKWRFTLSAAPLPPPVRGQKVDVQPVAGTVLVNGVTLTAGTRIPVGALVDATHGTVRLTSSNGAANFFGGAFRVSESAVAGTPTELRLRLGSTAVCVKKHSSSAAPRPKVLDSLWGNGKGTFVTRGRYASAAVRGTWWHTVDRCDGTLVAVRRGIVAVRDLKRGTTTLVRAGKQVLVKP